MDGKRVRVFSLHKFFESGERLDVAKRQLIAVSNRIFCIQKGYVGLFIGSGKNKRLLVIMQPNTVFPLDLGIAYGSPLWGGEIRYRALTNATVYSIPKADYTRESHSSLELITNQLAEAKRAQSLLMERMVNLFISDVTKRLTMRLILLAAYLGKKEGDKVVLQVPLTYVDLAESIGTTRETINRLITKLQKDDLINIDKKIITINSLGKLEQFYVNYKKPKPRTKKPD